MVAKNDSKRWHEQGVPWSIFIWVMAIFTIACTTFLVQHEQIKENIQIEMQARIQADNINDQKADDIKAVLVGIQAELKNLDLRLIEIKQDIKSLK